MSRRTTDQERFRFKPQSQQPFQRQQDRVQLAPSPVSSPVPTESSRYSYPSQPPPSPPPPSETPSSWTGANRRTPTQIPQRTSSKTTQTSQQTDTAKSTTTAASKSTATVAPIRTARSIDSVLSAERFSRIPTPRIPITQPSDPENLPRTEVEKQPDAQIRNKNFLSSTELEALSPEQQEEHVRLTRLTPDPYSTSLANFQEALGLSTSQFNFFIDFIHSEIEETGLLAFTIPNGPVALAVRDEIVENCIQAAELIRAVPSAYTHSPSFFSNTALPTGTFPVTPTWFMTNWIENIKKRVLGDGDSEAKEDVLQGRVKGPPVGDGASIIGGESEYEGWRIVLPPDSFAARVADAEIDQCIVSIQIISIGTREERKPVEIAASRILRANADSKLHQSYSFDELVRIAENKLNADGLYEPIEIRYGILWYFHRGDVKTVTDQDDFEVAISRLYLARGRDNVFVFNLQPEFTDRRAERLALQEQLRAEAEEQARIDAEDDEAIERLAAEADGLAVGDVEGKGKEVDICPRTPNMSATVRGPDDGKEFWPLGGILALRGDTLSPGTNFTPGQSPPFSPASHDTRVTTPPKPKALYFDNDYRSDITLSPGHSPTKIRKGHTVKSTLNSILRKKKWSVEERDAEWSDLFVIERRLAFKSGGDEDDGESETERYVSHEDVPLEEKNEIELLHEEDDAEDEEEEDDEVSAADRVVEKLQNLQNLPELNQIDDPSNSTPNYRWLECCRMFNIDPNRTALDELVYVAGLKTKIYQYQAFGVYWQMITSRKLGGGFVADSMGLGKTLSFLAFFVVERQLACLWAIVEKSRSAKDGRHLREDEHKEDDRCPGGRLTGWISCPCASSSPTAKMLPKPGVRLAVVPDKLVRNWWAEWKRHVDTSDGQVLGLTIVVDYKGAFDFKTPQADMTANSSLPRNKTRLEANKGTGKAKDAAKPNHSGWLVLTTLLNYRDWIKKFEYKGQVLGSDGTWKLGTRYQIVIGIAMIDESHEEYLKGTGRGKVLHDLPGAQKPFLWGYSGTPFSQSPRGIEGVLVAIEQQASRAGSTWTDDPLLRDFVYRRLDSICKDFDKELQSEKPDNSKVDKTLEAFKPFLHNFVMRRTAETLWFGHRLIKLKPHCHQDVFLAPNPVYKTRVAGFHKRILDYEASFEAEKQQKLVELQERWDDFPEKRLSDNRPTKLRFNTMCRLQWRLRIFASFPYLIKLVHSKDTKAKVDLTSEETLLFMAAGRTSEKLKDNSYYSHIRNIVEESPKLLWLYSFIQLIDQQTDYQGEQQKLIIMTSFPQVAFILKMFMLKYFPKKDETVGLILPRMKIKDRMATLEAFTDVLDDKGKRKQPRNNQILIGTTRLIGTGLQLTRAANVVLMEPDYEFVNEIQVYGRVHRIGQKNDCSFSYRLIDTVNEVERAIIKRQKDRKEAFGRVLSNRECEVMLSKARPSALDVTESSRDRPLTPVR